MIDLFYRAIERLLVLPDAKKPDDHKKSLLKVLPSHTCVECDVCMRNVQEHNRWSAVLWPFILIYFFVQLTIPVLFAEEIESGSGGLLPVVSSMSEASPSASSSSSYEDLIAIDTGSGGSSVSFLDSTSSSFSPSSVSSELALSEGEGSSESSGQSQSLQTSIPPATTSVVISELLWMGSDLSTADEWVELAGVGPLGASRQSLVGWTLTILSGAQESVIATFGEQSIGPGEFVIASNYDEPASRIAVTPALVTSDISLPNTKLLLRLRDASGELMDEVDDFVGAPFAGRNATGTGSRASMERIDLQIPGIVKENWRTAETFMGVDDGAPLFATPGFAYGQGPSIDTQAPLDVTENSALQLSGSILVSWKQSRSLDVSLQRLTMGDDVIDLPRTATGYLITKSVQSDSLEIKLQSIDRSGNISDGVRIHVEPLYKLKITEVLANPTGLDTHEWIELANLDDHPIPLTGIRLNIGSKSFSFIESTPELQAAEHRAFPASLTGLALENAGATIRLYQRSILLDTFIYGITAEEVSVGRSRTDPQSIHAFCIPTKDRANDVHMLDPKIIIASGIPSGTKVTLNLEARVSTGSLASAKCRWDFGDGFGSASCNPPSHLQKSEGKYDITLYLSDYCGNTMIRTQRIYVFRKANNETEIAQDTACTAGSFSGAVLSEVLPNPSGDEESGEWIELQNKTSVDLPLCGWSLDDGEVGGSVFELDDYVLPGSGYLLLPRSATKIALNNDKETLTLLGPSQSESGSVIQARMLYTKAPEDQSFALASTGTAVWTLLLTPGQVNAFETQQALLVADISYDQRIMITEIYPSPLTGESEWIELYNFSDQEISVQDWVIDDVVDGGSKPWRIKAAVTIPPHQPFLFSLSGSTLALNNGGDSARLLTPTGDIVYEVIYPSIKKGTAYSCNTCVMNKKFYQLNEFSPNIKEEWCITDTPSPYTYAQCHIQVKSKTPKTTSALYRGKKSNLYEEELRIRYEAGAETGSGQKLPLSGLFSDLQGLLQVNSANELSEAEKDRFNLHMMIIATMVFVGSSIVWLIRRR